MEQQREAVAWLPGARGTAHKQRARGGWGMRKIVIRSAYIYYLMRVKRGSRWDHDAEEVTVERKNEALTV